MSLRFSRFSDFTCDSLVVSEETRPSLASCASASACMRACRESAATLDADASWARTSFSTRTRVLDSCASAAFSCCSASKSAWVCVGLLSSRRTVSAFTTAPGCTKICSTRPSVAAGIQRMSSGTSVPRPRTWRTIEPRFTESGHTVAFSTVGAAGFKRDKPTVMRAITTRPTAPMMIRRIFLFLATLAGR